MAGPTRRCSRLHLAAPTRERPFGPTNQLFIDPSECIDCRACESECPWEAIFDEDSVPAEFHEDIALNAMTLEHPHEFDVPVERLHRPVTPEAVEANKRAWAVTVGDESEAPAQQSSMKA